MQKVRMRAWSVSVIIVLVLIIDQVIKFWVKTTMALGEEFKITEWFRIHFIENKGMAFGMDFIGTWPLTLFRVMAVALFIYLLVKIVKNPERYPFGLAICLAFVIAGAAGNIIDNCIYGLIFSESTPFNVAMIMDWGTGYADFMHGKVVDMFYFPLIDTFWPDWVPLLGGSRFSFFNAIFNFADASISCGSIVLILLYHRFLFTK